jgi:membrane-bound lytic murein transglycosylase D
LLLLCGSPAAPAQSVERTLEAAPRWVASPGFERPAGLSDEIGFWVRIYSQVTTRGGLVHDDRHLAVVYEQLDFPERSSNAERLRLVDRARGRHAAALRSLAARLRALPAGAVPDPGSVPPDELLVLEAWPEGTGAVTFENAAEHIRFQLGQRDRFLEGYVRAGAFESHLREVMERLGLPGELAALPHVESSFNARAYSKVGAAGIWQFMPGTGRRWLRIDDAVDERRDPYKSTVAAARFLQQNRRVLDNWPLALTAYNHGAGGLRRATREMGTSDISTLVKTYQGPAFGFASRNFFVSFMAALEVDRNAAWYFGEVQRDRPDDSRVVVLPEYVPAAALARVFGVDKARLRELNLPLLSPVWEGQRYVPQGYALRVPADARPTAEALHDLRPAERFSGQMRTQAYKVRRGDTLGSIANRFGTTKRWLLANNGLRSSRQVKRGMVLRLPGLAAGPRAKGSHMVYVPPAGNVFLAGLPDKTESVAAVVVAAAEAEESAAEAGEAVAANADEMEEPVPVAEATGSEPVAAGTAPTELVAAAGDSAAAKTVASLPAEAEMPTESAAATAEPLTEAAAEEAGPGLVPGVQSAASADPADYSVADDQTIAVLGAENLGQLARWSGVDIARLRQLNHLKPKAPLVMGRRLKVELRGVNAADFERERTAWHRALQAAYFTQYRIVGTDRHQMRVGESLWSLTRQHGVPVWLLQQYNPDLDFGTIKAGMEIVLPRILASDRGAN